MEKEIFYFGILIGLTFMQGLTAWKVRQRKKPYIQAFACLMFWFSAVAAIEGFWYNFFGEELPITVSTFLDYTVIPLYYVEVLCLTHQNVALLSWRKRWGYGAIIAAPMVVFFMCVFATGQQEITILTYALMTAYAILVSLLAFHHLWRFQKLLKNISVEKRREEQNVTWVVKILLMTLVQLIMYVIYDYLPSITIYYLISFLTICLHGHYIRKQVPIDLKKQRTTETEIIEQQKEAIKELKDATSDLKQKIDFDTAIKAFRVEHPSFDMRLRSLTETKLTKRDIVLCCLIYEGKRIPEIADYLGISPSSVEVARHRLRGKLNLEKGANMQKIIRESIG